MNMERLVRLYWLAVSRADRVAALVIRARIASTTWQPVDDTYPLFTNRRSAA